jgi:hypothetical protein
MSCGGGSERGPRCGCGGAGARDAEAVAPASVVLLLRGVESKERARWLVGERWSDTPHCTDVVLVVFSEFQASLRSI